MAYGPVRRHRPCAAGRRSSGVLWVHTAVHRAAEWHRVLADHDWHHDIGWYGIGWAWGVLTMKAALATRPAAETNARLLELAHTASETTTNNQQASGQTTYTQILIYDGFMLDARITAVYFCMICVYIYLLARLRAAAPKLTLAQIFGTIIIDVVLTIGPLLPSFEGTIPQILLKPAATAVGLGVVCNVLLFPKSTSYIVLDSVKQLLLPMSEFVDACRISFDDSAKPMSVARLKAAKAAGMATYNGLEANLGFLALDVSICRWNFEDIGLLRKPLKHLFVTWESLIDSQIIRAKSQAKRQEFKEKDEHKQSQIRGKPGQHQLAQQIDFARLFRNDTDSQDLFAQSMEALREASDPLMITCQEALGAMVETLSAVNERKYFKQPSAETCQVMGSRHRQILEKLQADIKLFTISTPHRVLEPNTHFFGADGNLSLPPGSGIAPVRGMIIALIWEERVMSFARALEYLLAQLVALEIHRTKTRLWMPTGLRHLGPWVFGREATPRVTPVLNEMEEEQVTSEPKKSKKHSHKKQDGDKDDGTEDNVRSTAGQLESIRLHRGKQRSRVGSISLAIFKWFSSTSGLYALRVVIVTIALGIPAALPSTAGFFYREKGLWALIMAQVGMVPYAADFTWGLMLRLTGTVVGGVLGLVAWYIGAGDGPGNPYGIAAICVPFILVFMWGRLFGPPAFLQAIMLCAATFFLTVAYSWVDTHIPSDYGNPGVGYNVFWRRTLLVIVGFTTAAIVMFFPRPPSAGRHYRRVLSATLSRFQDLYALFIMNMRKKHTDQAASVELLSTLEKSTIASGELLNSVAGPIQFIKFEFSSTDWSAAGLSELTALAMDVNFNLYQLFYYSSSLPDDFRRRFVLLSGVFEEQFVGDLMAVLSLLRHALETGEALPSVMSSPLMVRAFQDRMYRTHSHQHGRQPEEREEHVRKLLGPGHEAYDRDRAEWVQEMVMVVKEELGETHVVDVEDWGDGLYGGEDAIELREAKEEDGLLEENLRT
ncbi:hypothetical protein EDD37DRAFT_681496 [Exophiala viscosa]|uniref:ER transporter 6TM N-terminal domain-containing protein n=1 Tax=Exophiala viscosa TaxID=2486360 RepID=A0AAN6IBC8_9EURO|nr:hypothetical protein EDD36DRAFT_466774 [Exophiala viscosa]KAI1624498.1 hypothetical protein EDD37DRAFT_681496 [Exophiala viscosa]